MEIKAFFDPRTYTLTYVVHDPATRDAVVIDPVLDYEPAASKVWTESVEQVLRFTREADLRVHLILETHAHADHLSGSQAIKQKHPNARVGIGRRITEVQKLFKEVFDLPDSFPTDGRQFDLLLDEGAPLQAGSITIETLFTPGHTPACATYKIGNAIFTGDALFMPDQGTGRCDFPGGSARDLYRSVTEKIYTLPGETEVYVGHDYQPGGRDVAYRSTVAEQRERNVQLPAGITEADFVARREARDATLSAPRLLFQSVQVNIDAGSLPPPARNGRRYLKIPINVFKPEPEGEIELAKV